LREIILSYRSSQTIWEKVAIPESHIEVLRGITTTYGIFNIIKNSPSLNARLLGATRACRIGAPLEIEGGLSGFNWWATQWPRTTTSIDQNLRCETLFNCGAGTPQRIVFHLF
jgi:hypothetical protein